jgi:hypothetical protein
MHDHAVVQTEDRGVGADAERQRQDGDRCESGTGGQNANGVTNILSNHVMMLTQGGWKKIDQRTGPDRRDGEAAVLAPCVAKLRDKGAFHFVPILVAELSRIAPEKCAVDGGGAHVRAFVE